MGPRFKKVHWDGRDRIGHLVASGMYFVLLRTDQGRATKRILFVQ